MVTSSRDREQQLIDLCLAAIDGELNLCNGKDACIVRLAGLLTRIHYADAGQRMLDAANTYLNRHPEQSVPIVDMVKRGWVSGLPRFRSMLETALERRMQAGDRKNDQ